MSENNQSLSRSWLFKTGLGVLLGLMLLARIGYGQDEENLKQAILQGFIHLQAVTPVAVDQVQKIQPGTALKLSVEVENIGAQPSAVGKIFIRYAFGRPLDSEVTSVIFETEKKELPSIMPGQKIEISFETPQQTPSLLDFVRYDWLMREYQAVVTVESEEKKIGSLPLTVSAYYYPGIPKEFPSEVQSQLSEEEVLVPAA